MKLWKKIFSWLSIVVISVSLVVGTVHAEENGDIGDFGAFVTEDNRDLFLNEIKSDLERFQENVSLPSRPGYTPVSAQIGLSFMQSMAWVGRVLDKTLFNFVGLFIIVGYIFWIMFETYNMMANGQDVKKLVTDLVKKGFWVAIWVIVLSYGPDKLFKQIISPIIEFGSYLSDLILNSVTTMIGAPLPDTCTSIQNFVNTNLKDATAIDADTVSNILCMATRASGFFATAIQVGFKWMIGGLGTSGFTVLIGLIFVVLFVYNMYKFALMALGVIADLFLAILLLPFTAIAETMTKTSYSGIAGTIYNGFLDLFKVESFSISSQILRFIKAAIYFITLSIVFSICVILMSDTINANLLVMAFNIDNTEYLTVLLIGCLVTYLATQADKIAKDMGGAIDDSFGKQVGNDIKKYYTSARDGFLKYAKIFKESRKK